MPSAQGAGNGANWPLVVCLVPLALARSRTNCALRMGLAHRCQALGWPPCSRSLARQHSDDTQPSGRAL